MVSKAASSILAIVAVLVAAGLHVLLVWEGRPSDRPYYAADALYPIEGVALVYTTIMQLLGASVWARVNLPPPPDKVASRQLAIVTGANTGIGLETATRLVVDYGWDVILACRSKDKALAAQQQILDQMVESSSATSKGQPIVLEKVLDLSDFDSIRQFSDEFKTKYNNLDVLVNNAGRNTSRKSGIFDLMFQANFLGHFALTQLLLPELKANGSGKVVNLASVMHHFSGTQEIDEEYWKTRALYSPETPPSIYPASKLAAILFSKELNRRYRADGIVSVATNPGAAATDIWRGYPSFVRSAMQLIFLSPSQAGVPVAAACVDDTLGVEPNSYYVQPYWQLDYQRVPYPATEFLGPYVGYAVTAPRLPSDDGAKAGATLWDVCSELIHDEL